MSTPKPLNAVNALRLHLKQLERGVNEARTRRLGPTAAPSAGSNPMSGSSGSFGSNSPQGHARSNNPSFGSQPPMSRQPSSYPLPTPAVPAATPSSVSSKPKAKPKNGTDFSAFFQDITKREAS